MAERSRRSPTGVGLGLRWEFLEELLDRDPLPLAFLEVCPENYMERGGYYPAALEQAADRYPILTHGLTLSPGSAEPPDARYLEELRRIVSLTGSPWHSDHLSLSLTSGLVLHELLPLQHAREVAQCVADNVRRAEDALGVPMLVENISWYAHPARPEMAEVEFIQRIVDSSQCGVLLDVNNVYVNSLNHGFEARAFIEALPLHQVRQLHVAGHTRGPSGLVIDTHGAAVCSEVMELLEFTVERVGPVPVLLERDKNIPDLDTLLAEVTALDAAYQRALIHRATGHAPSA